MHNFRTEINLPPLPPFAHEAQLLTAGSCFADHLGQQLTDHKFQCVTNPFGTSYNPLAIHQTLLLALNHKRPDPSLYVQSQDTWRHLVFHSEWSDANREKLASAIEQQLDRVGQSLKNTTVVILTYGTAWAYRHLSTGQVVGNCHKLPAQHFEKFLLSPAQIIDSFKLLYEALTSATPTIRLILTVSPVRHTRDTLELNSVSKSALRLACHYITRQFSGVEYFPAYEMMMDDLRDYRFYEPDMIHPSPVARDYIWEKFIHRYFTANTQQLISKIAFVKKSLAHRAFHPTSPSHQDFLRQLLVRLEELQPEVDVSEEIKTVRTQLQS